VDNRLSLSHYDGGRKHGRTQAILSRRAKEEGPGVAAQLRKSAAAVPKDLGIDLGLLNRWRRGEKQEGDSRKAFTEQGVPRDEEVARLRRENEELPEGMKS
jgi:hypothetical protein